MGMNCKDFGYVPPIRYRPFISCPHKFTEYDRRRIGLDSLIWYLGYYNDGGVNDTEIEQLRGQVRQLDADNPTEAERRRWELVR